MPVEWEDTHFSELFIEKKNVTSDFEKYPLYSLTIEEGVVPKSERYERSHLVKKDDIFKIVSENDFVYNPMNVRFGALARYKGQEDVSVSGYYDIFSVKESVSKEYMENFLLSEPMINYYNRVSTGSLKEKQRVHFSQFLDFVLPIPPLPEQQKIAEILSMQDKLIELQEKKIEQLKELKKAYLQKMFPKKGSKYPELRFKGFTDPWEQRELGDLADIIGGGTPSTSNDDYWDGDIDWYAPAEIADQIYVSSSERKITQQGYENCSAKMLPVGTVLFTSRAGIGKTAILRKEGCTNQGFQSIVPHKNMLDSYFIFSRTEELKRYGETKGAGSTFVEVSGKQMASMELMMPKTIEEQKAIGSYFQNLDHLITLHQRKSEQEKQKKKALMQLLLTGKVRCQ